MIGRKQPRITEDDNVKPKGFDDFELRLGDVMRGERATMGKSLLDVQRELRIKAAYIAAIENCDPSVFDTPGFIAGYVRSYARYLNMDAEKAFAEFCRESGFEVAHGMSAQASVVKKQNRAEPIAGAARDPFTSPGTPFTPQKESWFSHIQPSAIGSILVLVGLIAAIGFGGWSVLKEVQQVQFAPVDQTPVVLADLDPLEAAVAPEENEDAVTAALDVSRADALDRLYRPQALEVPVLVARDGPISTLNPDTMSNFASPTLPKVQITEEQRIDEVVPQVVEPAAPTLVMVAVRPSWVRVKSVEGTVLFEGIMESGQSWEVPATEEPPLLRAGESGAIYFAVNGEHYGPVGQSGVVTKNVAMSIDAVTERYQVADVERDRDLARMVAEAQTPVIQD